MIAKNIVFNKRVLAKIICVKLIYSSRVRKTKKISILCYLYYIEYNSFMVHEKSWLLQRLI